MCIGSLDVTCCENFLLESRTRKHAFACIRPIMKRDDRCLQLDEASMIKMQIEFTSTRHNARLMVERFGAQENSKVSSTTRYIYSIE